MSIQIEFWVYSPGRNAIFVVLVKPCYLTRFPNTGVSPGHFRYAYSSSRTLVCLLYYHTGLLARRIKTKDGNLLKYLKFGLDWIIHGLHELDIINYLA